MTELVDGTPVAAAVREVVDTALPDWRVSEVDRVEDRAEGVYPVVVTAGRRRRDIVVKTPGDVALETFRSEPYLQVAVGRRTDLPVPGVVGVVDDPADHQPCYLVERPDGRRPAEQADGPAPAVRDHLAREAGEYLGRLHLLGSFERFGPLRLRSDGDAVRSRPDPKDDAGIVEPEFAIEVGDDGWATWRERFRTLVEARLADLDEGCQDLPADVRAALDAVRVPTAEAVLAHGDYGYRSLRVDSETGETVAVTDLGDVATAAARYDLVTAIDRLSGWAGPTADRRHRVRARVLDGYEVATGLRPDLGGPAVDAYRIASRLPALAASERPRPVRRHRKHLGTLVERCRDAGPV